MSILEINEHNMYLEKSGWLGKKSMPKNVFKETVKKKKDFNKLEDEIISIFGDPEKVQLNISGLNKIVGRC